MLGGFLGSGKTTTLLRLAQQLQRMKKRVGLITNDQAAGLVDTALMEELNLPVSEIAGGCFCCRSGMLVEALEKLTADSHPEVFLAEPVGSCTDLVATVSLPLERIYKSGYVMAPYAVLVDPYRAMQTLGVEAEPIFSPDVNYIYRKQLEEAEIIVINKTDVIAPERLARLREALAREYPEAEIMAVASRDGTGLEPLIKALTTREGKTKRVMEVDYERYGKGEAMLGWFNGRYEVGVTKEEGFDGNVWLLALAKRVQTILQAEGIEVAHFKMSLAGAGAGQATVKKGARTAKSPPPELAAVSLVHTAGEAEMRRSLTTPLSAGVLTVNLRAEGAPEALAAAIRSALKAGAKGITVKPQQEEAFRPGQPTPVHRVATV
jgi:G3E family GTPase